MGVPPPTQEGLGFTQSSGGVMQIDLLNPPVEHKEGHQWIKSAAAGWQYVHTEGGLDNAEVKTKVKEALAKVGASPEVAREMYAVVGWVTAHYEMQVEDLKKQVLQLEDTVGELRAQLTASKAAIAGYERKIGEIHEATRPKSTEVGFWTRHKKEFVALCRNEG